MSKRVVKIVVEETLPSWNTLYKNQNIHVRRRLVDYWHNQVYAEALNQLKGNDRSVFRSAVSIHVTNWYNNRARMVDPDNVCSKVAIDALKEMLLTDDSASYVDSVTTACRYEKGCVPHCEIIISEEGNDRKKEQRTD